MLDVVLFTILYFKMRRRQTRQICITGLLYRQSRMCLSLIATDFECISISQDISETLWAIKDCPKLHLPVYLHFMFLLCCADNLKITDFGLATVFRHQGKERSLGRCCGTPPYVAPEVMYTNSDSDCTVYT